MNASARLSRRLFHWAHAKVIYPGTIRIVGEGYLFTRLNELQALQRLDETEFRYQQRDRLAKLLAYARLHCAHYRGSWPELRDVNAEAVFEYLRALPLLTKRDLQEHADGLLARPRLRHVTAKITGGSTGQAVTVIKDRTATAMERAAMWLGYGWRGVHIGDRAVRFWGSPFATRRKLVTAAADFSMHRIRFSAFAFDDADLERYWKRCLAFRPDYFHGYVSMLEAFARFVASRGYDGRQLPLKSIVATSEVLSQPQRALLEETFGTPVQIEYGCGELGPIAYECERGSLHLMAVDVVVEVLRPDGTPAPLGDTGEIVITDLNNRAMPLVRYRIGDQGILGSACGCGRTWPVLHKIWGRAYDFVAAPDGRRYHGEFFMYLFEDLRRRGAGVEGFQVTQSGATALEVTVASKRPLSAEQEQVLRHLFSERLPTMTIDLRTVPAIERSPSGKMQVIRNLWTTRAANAPGQQAGPRSPERGLPQR